MKSIQPLMLSAALLAGTAVQGRAQLPTYTIATVAGTGNAGSLGDGGPATSAELNGPRGVTEDIYGNLYIAEYYGQRVRKVTPSGVITTLAGNGTAGYSGDGGPAASAELNGPYRVTVDAALNVYIPDSGNGRIRKVSANGIITTVVGNGTIANTGDGGLATAASLEYPEAVAFDSAGNYYVADEAANVVREVSPAGIITTAVGTGVANYTGDNGPATKATLNGPVGVQVDAAGNVYISDQVNNVIRKVTGGTITTVAGNGTFGFAGDGGPAIKAEFGYPASVGLDAAGNLYIPDVNNNRIRVLLTSGNIATVAGNGGEGYSGDNGPALSAQINVPRSVSVAPNGNVYVGDFGNNVVRKLTPVTASGTPTITNGGVTGIPDFGGFPAFSPNNFMAIYGSNLASATTSWSSFFTGNTAPTAIDKTQVTVNGQPAYIQYISPTQINILLPSGVAPGIQLLTVTTASGTSPTYQIVVNQLEPGFLAPAAFNVGGTQYVVALFSDGTYVLPTGAIAGITSRPANPGDTILLFGLGFGPVTPNVPSGQLAEQLTNLTTNFTASIGGTPATVSYAGLAPGFAGLYQFNIVVPQVPAGKAVPFTFTLGGAAGTQTLYLAVQ